MGYYSDVGIKCGKKAYEMFREAWTKYKFTPDEIYYSDSGFYTIVWYSRKIYGGIPEVDELREVMYKLNEKIDTEDDGTCDYDYAFIRIGESDTDVETDENSYDLDFYVERSFPKDGSQISGEESDSQILLSDFLNGS